MKIIFLVLVLLFINISNAFASSSVVINEFQVEPDGSEQWVELYNLSGSEIDLSNWIIDDGASPSTKFTIPDGEKIGASSFKVYKSGQFSFNVASPDTVKLIDNSNNLIDSKDYSKSPGENVSYSRNPDGGGIWQTATPTPGGTNGELQVNSETTDAGDVKITEIMPNPDGEEEWVELYNPNSGSVDLTGYKLDDKEGGSSPVSLNGFTINPTSYFVFSFTSSILNNEGDSVRFLDSQQNILDQVDYQDTQKGISFAKNSSGIFEKTSSPTPGTSNQISYVTSSDSQNNEEVKASATPSQTVAAKSSKTPTPTIKPSVLGEASKSTTTQTSTKSPSFTINLGDKEGSKDESSKTQGQKLEIQRWLFPAGFGLIGLAATLFSLRKFLKSE
ncbi:MAG TPA: lamin tail domain-containing protein [Patescibacteria group bacterium]